MAGAFRKEAWQLGEGRGIFIQETWPLIVEPLKFTIKTVYNSKMNNQFVFKLGKDGLSHCSIIPQ